MSRFAIVPGVCVLVWAAAVGSAAANPHDRTLAVVMTNDVKANAVKVYDVATGALLQTLSTHGKGGVGGNARGVRQYEGEVFAAVNNGSNSVAVFRRSGNRLKFDTLVSTTSKPVSIDFGNNHMYVAGANTVDSFAMNRGRVGWLDGTTTLALASGDAPPDGSTAQVGVVGRRQLLVTLKADPDPGTVDVVSLDDGAVKPESPVAVHAPTASLTPFGFDVYPDGSAIITLAHSSDNGVFRDGAFVDVEHSSQTAPCWMVRSGKYVYIANTASRTISRMIGTGSHLFEDQAIAATIATGNPTDLDASGHALAVIDHGGGASHLTIFSRNAFGELSAVGSAIDLGTANANGVAVVPPSDRDDD